MKRAWPPVAGRKRTGAAATMPRTRRAARDAGCPQYAHQRNPCEFYDHDLQLPMFGPENPPAIVMKNGDEGGSVAKSRAVVQSNLHKRCLFMFANHPSLPNWPPTGGWLSTVDILLLGRQWDCRPNHCLAARHFKSFSPLHPFLRAGCVQREICHLTATKICRKLLKRNMMREWRNWQTRWT